MLCTTLLGSALGIGFSLDVHMPRAVPYTSSIRGVPARCIMWSAWNHALAVVQVLTPTIQPPHMETAGPPRRSLSTSTKWHIIATSQIPTLRPSKHFDNLKFLDGTLSL
jgi:hypothetical protein